jgi:hypothetical protein
MGKMKERFHMNPFMDSFEENIINRSYVRQYKTESTLVDSVTGENVELSLSSVERAARDRRGFVKIIKEPESIKVLRDMPALSVRLFWWILERLKYDEDTIIIDGLKAQTELEYKSITSIYKAIEGLVESEIIAPMYGGIWLYYINPNLIFFGDAVEVWKRHKSTIKRRLSEGPNALTESLVKYKFEVSPDQVELINDPVLSDVITVTPVPGKDPVWDTEPAQSADDIKIPEETEEY